MSCSDCRVSVTTIIGIVPEGDTINRAAAALRTALVGRPLRSFEAPRLVGPTPAVGRIVESVKSHGKHLEIRFDDDLVLHTHMRMTGSWHLYREGERWRRPLRQVRVSLVVPEWVAVCFNAPVVETYRSINRTRHASAGGLGPDLCDQSADLAECVRRLAHYHDPQASIAEVLLDQRVMAGVGNVYRSEILWALELSPHAFIGSLESRDLVQVVNTAARMLRANLDHTRRVTTDRVPGGLAVYGRGFQPCARCGGTIDVSRVGEHNRVLYSCPECQVRGAPVVEPRIVDMTDPMQRPADPHPAAVMFLADVREARERDDTGGTRRTRAVGFGPDA
jgi:endonuclease VIII